MNIIKRLFKRTPKRTRGFEVVADDYRQHPSVDIRLPERGSKHAVAYDIYSPIDVIIAPKKKVLIWTDVKAYCLEDEGVFLNVRSSMGNSLIALANTIGWVESDYYNNAKNDGNLGLNLYNMGEESYVIKKGDRIGQAMFQKILVADNGNTDKKRAGGFGSSGK